MSLQGPACFGYRLSRGEGEWRWTAFDGEGRVSAQGRAQSRAMAAACVIRALAEKALAENVSADNAPAEDGARPAAQEGRAA